MHLVSWFWRYYRKMYLGSRSLSRLVVHALEVQSILLYFDPCKAPKVQDSADGSPNPTFGRGAEDKSSTPYIPYLISFHQ